MKFKTHSTILLRSPSLSYSNYSEAGLEEACRSDFFRAALLIASKSLYDALSKKQFQPHELEKKQLNSLWKYFNRMCFRSTPFGLFSSFSAVKTDGSGSLIQFSETAHTMHLHPSRNLDLHLGHTLQNAHAHSGRLRINGTVYTTGKELRYYRSNKSDQHAHFEFSLESIDLTPVLRGIAKKCVSWISYADLLSFLSSMVTCTEDAAIEFIDELFHLQVLESENNPGITGNSYVRTLIERFKHIERELHISDSVRGADAFFTRYIRPEAFVAHHQQLGDYLQQSGLLADHKKELFYIAWEKEISSGAISTHHIDQLSRSIDALDRLTSPVDIPELSAFIQDFTKKFEERTVPLLVALDPRQGIEYGMSGTSIGGEDFLETLLFSKQSVSTNNITWGPLQQLLMKKWNESKLQNQGHGIIRIEPADLPMTPADSKAFAYPTGIASLFRVVDDKVVLEQAGGACASALIGRFTIFSEEIRDAARALAAFEQANNPGVAFAELIHHCDTHADNINRREDLCLYDIPLLCQSNKAEEFQIKLNELFLAVRNGQLILFSSKLQKRVIPRLNSAYNFKRNDLPLFRFLCDLQFQGIKWKFSLNMAELFPGLEYYPRVEFESSVLNLASWHLRSETLLTLKHISNQSLPEKFKQFAAQLGIPRYFSLNEHDHQLVFDAHCSTDLQLLLNSIKLNSTVVLKEYLYPSNAMVVGNEEHPFMNQFVACHYTTQQVYPAVNIKTAHNRSIRKFIPGSSWIYWKIYCHPGHANTLIAGALARMVKLLPRDTKWFFVRYADPEHHIRLRIRNGDDRKIASSPLIERFFGKDAAQGDIDRIQSDTYQRELERYGDSIDDAETFFCLSSELVTAWIKQTHGKQHPHESALYFAIYSVAQLLTSLIPEPSLRIVFVKTAAEGFMSEYSNPSEIKHGLDTNYRIIRHVVDKVLSDNNYLKYRKIQTKMDRLIQFTARIGEQDEFRNPVKRHKLFVDLLHMHMNRIFALDARKQELACYHILYKSFLSADKRKA